MGVVAGIQTWLGSRVGLAVRSRVLFSAPLNTVISKIAATTSTATAMPANINMRLELLPSSSSSASLSWLAAAAALLRWAM